MGLLSRLRPRDAARERPRQPAPGRPEAPTGPRTPPITAADLAEEAAPGWSRLPPPAPLLDPMPLIVAADFDRSLPSRRRPDPVLVQPLGHLVVPDGPSGTVEAMAVIQTPPPGGDIPPASVPELVLAAAPAPEPERGPAPRPRPVLGPAPDVFSSKERSASSAARVSVAPGPVVPGAADDPPLLPAGRAGAPGSGAGPRVGAPHAGDAPGGPPPRSTTAPAASAAPIVSTAQSLPTVPTAVPAVPAPSARPGLTSAERPAALPLAQLRPVPGAVPASVPGTAPAALSGTVPDGPLPDGPLPVPPPTAPTASVGTPEAERVMPVLSPPGDQAPPDTAPGAQLGASEGALPVARGERNGVERDVVSLDLAQAGRSSTPEIRPSNGRPSHGVGVVRPVADPRHPGPGAAGPSAGEPSLGRPAPVPSATDPSAPRPTAPLVGSPRVHPDAPVPSSASGVLAAPAGPVEVTDPAAPEGPSSSALVLAPRPAPTGAGRAVGVPVTTTAPPPPTTAAGPATAALPAPPVRPPARPGLGAPIGAPPPTAVPLDKLQLVESAGRRVRVGEPGAARPLAVPRHQPHPAEPAVGPAPSAPPQPSEQALPDQRPVPAPAPPAVPPGVRPLGPWPAVRIETPTANRPSRPAPVAPLVAARRLSSRLRAEIDVKQAVGGQFGVDLSAVPIDRSAGAAWDANRIGATAFTDARGVHIPAAVGSLDSSTGRAVLAHELTHVAQRMAHPGPVPGEATPRGQRYEREALRVGRAVGAVPRSGMAGAVARAADAAPAGARVPGAAAGPVRAEQGRANSAPRDAQVAARPPVGAPTDRPAGAVVPSTPAGSPAAQTPPAASPPASLAVARPAPESDPALIEALVNRIGQVEALTDRLLAQQAAAAPIVARAPGAQALGAVGSPAASAPVPAGPVQRICKPGEVSDSHSHLDPPTRTELEKFVRMLFPVLRHELRADLREERDRSGLLSDMYGIW